MALVKDDFVNRSKRRNEDSIVEVVYALECAEQCAVAREERDAEREMRLRERELELLAQMREREERHEERMMSLFSSIMQHITMPPPPPQMCIPPYPTSYDPNSPYPP